MKEKKLVSPERTGKAHRHDGDPMEDATEEARGAVRGRAGAAEEIPRGHPAVLLSSLTAQEIAAIFHQATGSIYHKLSVAQQMLKKDLGRGVNLVDEQKLRNALKACLPPEQKFPPERRQAVLRAIRKEEPMWKKKISTALVFAIVMTLDRRRRAGREPPAFSANP